MSNENPTGLVKLRSLDSNEEDDQFYDSCDWCDCDGGAGCDT
jgi:hypothetical protein